MNRGSASAEPTESSESLEGHSQTATERNETMADPKAAAPSRGQLFDEQVVSQLRGALDEEKEQRKKRLSRREVVEQLKAELQEMLRAGWTYDQLVDVLVKKDFPVSAAMLRELLRTPKKRRSAGAKRQQTAPEAPGSKSKPTS